MSVGAIGSSALSQLFNIQRNYQQVRGEFKKLGQDLKGGNLAQVESDFVTLSQTAASQFGSNSPVSQTLNTIGQALQSGNLPAAQQAFGSLPVSLTGASAEPRYPQVGAMGKTTQNGMSRLGQALQAGNLAAARQAYSAMQQIWQQVPANTVPGFSTNGRTSGVASLAAGVTL